MTAILELRGVSRHFGGLKALDDVTFSIASGEIIGLIGPNGAGKTTLINTITGVHPSTSGAIMFEGRDITRNKPHQTARLGLARTFQIVQPFPQMTVAENVSAGALFAGHADSIRMARHMALEQLEFTGLAAVADKPASSLTLAQRKRLELAKSLAMRPRLLMLDEVNAGLNAAEIDDALAIIRQISATGVTILIVEHLMKVVLTLSSRIVVLHHGQLIAEGEPQSVVADQTVMEAYLGSRYAARMSEGAGQA